MNSRRRAVLYISAKLLEHNAFYSLHGQTLQRPLLDLTDDRILPPSAASTPSNFFAENKLRGAFVVEERREE